MFTPFGVIMLFVPGLLFPMLGVDLDADGLMMASTVGSMLLSLGLICWFARNEDASNIALRAILVGNFLFHAIDSFLTGRATLMGIMNAAGYMFSGMHFMMAMGFGYFLWNKFRRIVV